MAKGLNRVMRPLAKGVALAVLGTAMQGMLPGSLSSSFSLIPAAYAEEEKKRETRRTPALREATYKRLAEAQELVDLKDYAGADQVLAKHSVLGVPEASLAQYGAVSEPVVLAMLAGALEKSGADIGIAVSGIAGRNYSIFVGCGPSGINNSIEFNIIFF